MPTSKDPKKRARQLANLRTGPPARQGNQLARQHGSYAEVTAEDRAGEVEMIFEALAADAPIRGADGGLPAADSVVVEMLAENRVRRKRVNLEELRHGIEDRNGQIRSIVQFGWRLDEQALRLCSELGMTPAARARIGVDVVKGLSAAERLEDHLARTYGDEVIEGEATE